MELVFEPSLGTMDGELFIEVLDDDVFEGEELFLIRLNVSVSDPRDEDMLMVGIQYLKIQISGDASDGMAWIITLTPLPLHTLEMLSI